ncbi:uncharacterized protein V6R79_010735 [Siganus canaliculatus]
MDRSKLERTLTCFQAFARGYLVRSDVSRAREDFEAIVQEIDGSLTHLVWRKFVFPVPHFTDTDGPLPQFIPSSTSRAAHSRLDVSDSQLSPTASVSLAEEGRPHHTQLQKTEAERDDSQAKVQESLTKDFVPSSDDGTTGVRQEESTVGDKDGGMVESTGDSTTVWSSLELDINYDHLHKGSEQYFLAQEVSRTPETLRIHRNKLTMELLWLQQAIDSRKKYLSLKNRLSIS